VQAAKGDIALSVEVTVPPMAVTIASTPIVLPWTFGGARGEDSGARIR